MGWNGKPGGANNNMDGFCLARSECQFVSLFVQRSVRKQKTDSGGLTLEENIFSSLQTILESNS